MTEIPDRDSWQFVAWRLYIALQIHDFRRCNRWDSVDEDAITLYEQKMVSESDD